MMTESEMKQLLQQDGKKVEAALQELLPELSLPLLPLPSWLRKLCHNHLRQGWYFHLPPWS